MPRVRPRRAGQVRHPSDDHGDGDLHDDGRGARDDQQRDGAAEPVVHAAHARRELGGEGGAVVGEAGERGERQDRGDDRADRHRDRVEVEQPPPDQQQRGQHREQEQLPRLPRIAEPVDERPGRHRPGGGGGHPAERTEATAARSRAGGRSPRTRRPAPSASRHSATMPASVPSAIDAGDGGAGRVAQREAPGDRPDGAQGRPAEHVHRHGEARERPAARDASRRPASRCARGTARASAPSAAIAGSCGPAPAQQRADDRVVVELRSGDAGRGAEEAGDDGQRPPAAGYARHAIATPIDTTRVATPGTQVMPTRNIAVISVRVRSGNRASLSGSSVRSTPSNSSGTISQPSTSVAPPTTTTACVDSGGERRGEEQHLQRERDQHAR